ncbi:MAG: four helix bundle protein [Ignavibacteriae bacterium]|nr:four helix bundle protein [Ignavibacteriota bacterium]
MNNHKDLKVVNQSGSLEAVKIGNEVVERKKTIKHFRDLEVYKMAFKAAMEIFEITKEFPVEERYSIVDQIRRSTRSVCSNISPVK